MLFAILTMSMAVGLVLGIAGGYASVQLPWPLTMMPFATAAAPAQPANAPGSPASTAAIDDAPSFDQGPVPSLPDAVHSSASPAERPAPPRPAGAPAKTADSPAGLSGAPGTGSLDVASYPAGAVVSLDGRVVGQTPLVLRDVPPGPHVVGIEAPGFARWAMSLDVSAGERTRVTAPLGK
jgi:hypothetical protein